ncbi:acyltransferase [Arthrobacter sp. MYb227]|uniref:acyltransferase family protein n=1 Tax=Arthrobacter sp. MYb227 TaxID=1848601 RepID=UPI000CFD6C9A|nr:acyltransferase family protein [Arthrobacter sp. MYb227]PQZ96023.1 acyltransferase [Arthrobacter sp. MYb227]
MSARSSTSKVAPKTRITTGLTAEFRPELQGLRALAVLLVMVYHVWVGRVSGGVDVFLMLSAFFLTGSFIRKVETGRKLALSSYWLNVFRRLLPAAVVVLLATLIASAALLPKARWSSIMEQITASLFYVQNWQLAKDSVDYYAANHATASPLQHFWSLSIQGQIFILWPLLLLGGMLIWKKLRGKFPVLSYRSVMGIIFGAVFIASLGYSISTTASRQEWAYFDTVARLWEFALGSLIAISLPLLQRIPRVISVPLGWVGLAAIISCGMLLQVEYQFPGYLALWPVLAAGVIILAPASRWGVNRVLAHPALGWLGDVSYALYLWHWPVMIFFLVESGQDGFSLGEGLGLMLISLLLAWATTRIIESPMRSWTWLSAKRRRVGWGIAALIAVVMVPLSGWEYQVSAEERRAAAQQPYDNPGAEILLPGFTDEANPNAVMIPLTSKLDEQWSNYGEDCSGEWAPEQDSMENCQQGGNPQASKTIVLVGDSHAQHWSGAVDVMATKQGWRWILLTKPSCRFGGPSETRGEECAAFNTAASEYVLEHSPDAVITLGSFSVLGEDEDGNTPAAQEHIVPGYEQGVRPFLDAGIPVVALRDTPRFVNPPPECVDRFGSEAPECQASVEDLLATDSPLLELDESGSLGENFSTMDMSEVLCPDGICKPVIGNVLVYMDESHLTGVFARSAAAEFERRFLASLNPSLQ